MDELFALLIGSALDSFAEALLQIGLEIVLDVFSRSVGEKIKDFPVGSPILALMGYLVLGVGVGFGCYLAFPHPLVPPSKVHGISLLISPLITGLVMAQVGAVIRRKGKSSVRIESFAYGFTFAFGVALVRFFMVRV
jgi:hypothetical protein